ncbi:outer membrane protein assembly factor BamE [Candidatus Steffania adelgidicola]|uniref:outer membrane protein assembly factor BamE n=1 Tax=Candidatus Steffania adelgidicola TaxID=1076626 RepID=UPI002A4E161F|nr:outer membrane protein assembly factor BamE [Candidatus Steffania adelgidicola]UDG79623.1 Outer membrane protein assembly factor BamE [Candidatus Steffania adelgidicola]
MIMRFQTFTIAISIILMCTVGCSLVEKVVYHPIIKKIDYLTEADIDKIHTGLSKEEVIQILGNSMIKDPFGSNTWYYIFQHKLDHAPITQQTLTLTFNKDDILIQINNKGSLESSHPGSSKRIR